MSQDNLRSILQENKLTSKNYLDWERNLRTVLKEQGKLYTINEDPLTEPSKDSTDEEFVKYEKYKADAEDVSCLILASISAEFQKQCINMRCWEMMGHLRCLLKEEARHLRIKSWYGKRPTPIEPVIKGKTRDVILVQKKEMNRKGYSRPRSQTKKKSLKEGNCFHCGEKGHWKRNCDKYLEELKKLRAGVTRNLSGIY